MREKYLTTKSAAAQLATKRWNADQPQPHAPGAAASKLVAARWQKGVTSADLKHLRTISKLGGRPRSTERCPCGTMTRIRAAKRGHKCEAAA